MKFINLKEKDTVECFLRSRKVNPTVSDSICNMHTIAYLHKANAERAWPIGLRVYKIMKDIQLFLIVSHFLNKIVQSNPHFF